MEAEQKNKISHRFKAVQAFAQFYSQMPVKPMKPLIVKSELFLITGNKGKLAEFNSILGQYVTLKNIDYDLPEY